MKIAFFVQYCHEAGTYFRWHNLARALVLQGHQVDIYAGDFNYKSIKRKEIRDGVRYFITPSLLSSRIFGNPSDPFTALYRCFQKVEKEYDAYHLFQPFLQAFLPWRMLKIKRKGIFFYDWDDLWTGGLFTSPQNWRDKYTQHIVQWLESNLPLITDRTTVCSSFLKGKTITDSSILYNGFWDNKTTITKTDLRKKWAFKADAFYLAYIGKTADELSWIATAIALLSEENIRFQLIIAGPPISAVNSTILGNHPNVRYLGEVSSLDASELAKASDLGLLPLADNQFNRSRFPIKFFDFLSVGTPIYYSEVGEIKLIGNNINAAYPAANSQDEWAAKLITVIRKIREQQPLVPIEQLINKYSWNSIANKLVGYYEAKF